MLSACDIDAKANLLWLKIKFRINGCCKSLLMNIYGNICLSEWWDNGKTLASFKAKLALSIVYRNSSLWNENLVIIYSALCHFKLISCYFCQSNTKGHFFRSKFHRCTATAHGEHSCQAPKRTRSPFALHYIPSCLKPWFDIDAKCILL